MFDPYHKWLGIPPDQRPPTHYQLLGISPREQDREVIREAVIRQTAHLRTYQAGPLSAECTRLLNEIAQAQTVLLDPGKRRAYDGRLATNAIASRKWEPAAPSLRPEIEVTPKRAKVTQTSRALVLLLGALLLLAGGGFAAWWSGVLAFSFQKPASNAPPTDADPSGLERVATSSPPNSAPEPGPWAHTEISQAQHVNDLLRLEPGTAISTRESYSGPIEVTVVAATERTNLRLHASGGASVMFNFTGNCNQDGLLICRPIPSTVGDFSRDEQIVSPDFIPPQTLHTLRWRLTEEGMTVSVNDKIVFRENRKYDLSNRRPVKVAAYDSPLQVKSLLVTPIR